jgi:hypothetical protein
MRLVLGSVALVFAVLLPASGCDLVDKLQGEDTTAAQTVEIPGQGVSFEVPGDWEAISTETVKGAGQDSGVFAEMADRMGMDEAQMNKMISGIDVFVGAPHAEHGMLHNVNAMHFAGSTLPSKGTFELQFRTLGATNIESADVSTAAGDGYRVSYNLSMKGQDIVGTALIIDHGSVILDITVTTDDADATDQLADQLVASLADAD